MVSLRKAAIAIKQNNIKNELREQERELSRQRREAFESAKTNEENKFNELISQTDLWHKSKQIREYISAVKEDAISKHGEIIIGSELDKWLTWASQQANRIDPLSSSSESILDQCYEDYVNSEDLDQI